MSTVFTFQPIRALEDMIPFGHSVVAYETNSSAFETADFISDITRGFWYPHRFGIIPDEISSLNTNQPFHEPYVKFSQMQKNCDGGYRYLTNHYLQNELKNEESYLTMRHATPDEACQIRKVIYTGKAHIAQMSDDDAADFLETHELTLLKLPIVLSSQRPYPRYKGF